MRNVFLAVFEISVSMSLIIFVLLLCSFVLNKRYAAKWKYWIWIIIAFRLLIPFDAADIFFDTFTPEKIQIRWNAEKNQRENISQNQTDINRKIFVKIPEVMTSSITEDNKITSIHITLIDLMAFLWMTGSLFFISVYLISYVYFKYQLKKSGSEVKDSTVLQQLSCLKYELHIKDTIWIVKYENVSSPMIIGFWKPILVLPDIKYEEENMYFILKHEMIHLKRKDVFTKLLFAAASAVHWFNPLIWMMQREAAVDMELSCDERVIHGMDYEVRKSYTETLLSTLNQQHTKKTVFSTQLYGGKQIMKNRFKNILSKRKKKNGAAVLFLTLILVTACGSIIGCSVTKERNVLDNEKMKNRNKSISKVMIEDNNNESFKNEIHKNETHNDESFKNETIKNGILKKRDLNKRDLNKEEPNKGTNKNETNKNETLKNETNKNEILKNETLNNKSVIADYLDEGQIYGYISVCSDEFVTIDRQIWATIESKYWKPEYNEDEGFEVVDVEGEDIKLPLRKDCVFSILENHWNPRVEISKKEFEKYLKEMDYPVLWVIDLENGEIKKIEEQYRP